MKLNFSNVLQMFFLLNRLYMNRESIQPYYYYCHKHEKKYNEYQQRAHEFLVKRENNIDLLPTFSLFDKFKNNFR